MSSIKYIVGVTLVVMAGLVLVGAMRLLMLKHDITAYKQYWDNQSRQSSNPDSVLYVALGDSAAQGIGASKPNKGYVGLLANQIAKSSGHSVHVVNLSVSGAKIHDVIATQVPQLLQMQLPAGSIVTVDIGANDLTSFDPGTFSTQMEQLFAQLPAHTIVADMPYFGGGRARKLESNATRASAIIHNLADRYKLTIAPLHDVTINNDGFWVYGADFFHPSDRGYVNWYQAFWQTLKP